MDNITKNRILLFLLILIIVGLITATFYGVSFYKKMTSENNSPVIVEDIQNSTSTPSTSTPVIVEGATSTQDTKIVGIKNTLEIFNLKENDVVTNKLTIEGKAKGWYFEGSFPVEVLDSKGKRLAIGPATAVSDWMVAEFVNFKITLNLASTTSATGTVVFMKDNPSGLPENDQSFILPVKFNLSN